MPEKSTVRRIVTHTNCWPTAKPRSDFDIGVCGASAMPYADFYSLADQIELLPTLYRIDWVDLARTDEQFRQSALANAKVIYEA